MSKPTQAPETPGQTPEELSAPERLGTFQFVAIREESDWANLAELLKNFPEVDEVKKRLGWMLGSANLTVVVEFQYIDKDFRDTFSAYFSKRFHTPSTRCARLHFFRGILTKERLLGEKLPRGSEYLGYSVLRPIHTRGLGRTLISPTLLPDPAPRHAHYKICEEEINLLGLTFSIKGFPYIAQDREVFVCAQASLWMLVRYFSNSYRTYREIGPHQLSNLVSDFTLGRAFPSQGLELWQASEILRRLGFHPVIHEKASFSESLANKLGFGTAEEGFRHLFYTYIESGIPLLVAYRTHAIVAFGHVSNYSKKIPKSAAGPDGVHHSSVWNEAFLVHDDAAHPYHHLELPTGPESKDRPKDDDRSFSAIRAFIAPMPEKAFLSADAYQLQALKLLRCGKSGVSTKCPALAKAISDRKIVLRSFLTTGTSFKRTIAARGLLPGFSDAYLHYSLPHFIWISEIHSLADYPRKCIGQIVWDATSSPHDGESFLFLQYPNMLIVNAVPHFNRQKGPLPKDLFEIPVENAPEDFLTFQPFENNLSQPA